MKHFTRPTALLAVLAIALAACSAAAAGTDDPSTTPPTTVPPAEDQLPTDEPIQWRPISPEGDLGTEGSVVGGGVLVAEDGNTVTVGFWMGVEDCFGVERIDIAETETKVAIDITVAARSADQVCIALAEARSVTVELDAPLGGRILEIGGAPVTG